MAWADEVSMHDRKIRRQSFFVGVAFGIVMMIASGFLIDYIVDILKHQ